MTAAMGFVDLLSEFTFVNPAHLRSYQVDDVPLD